MVVYIVVLYSVVSVVVVVYNMVVYSVVALLVVRELTVAIIGDCVVFFSKFWNILFLKICSV
jgi:hypothetical protein